MADPTIHDVLTRALEAYAALELLGEEIEDEWTYVTDLEAAWREHLTGLADARGHESVDATTEAAVDRLIDEVGRIEDPHRAIDWLSTFPQVLLVAFGASL